MATKSWLAKNNIEYQEKNVEQADVADELFALGYRSTPVIVIKTSAPVARGTVNGEQIIVGYNPSKLAKVLL